jgi:hypothetical protein
MQNDQTNITNLLAAALIEQLMPRLLAEMRPQEQAGPPVLDTEQVAKLIGRTPHWVRTHRLAMGGHRPDGTRRILFPRDRVLQYIQGQR